MKKLIFLFILLSSVLSINAQNSWTSINYEEDELIGTVGGTTKMYTDENGNTFEYGYLNDKKSFRCDITNNNNKIFNYNYYLNSSVKVVYGVIGLYDENDKLVTKWDESFFIPFNSSENVCRPKKWKKIMDYLNKNNGYVKVIVSVYHDNDFRMTIPCINN